MSISEMLNNTLHTAAQALQTPVVLILLILMVVTAACIGSIIVETFSEHRRLKRRLPQLLQRLKDEPGTDLAVMIEESGLLRRQKDELMKVVDAADEDEEARETVASNQLTDEQICYKKVLLLTDIIVKIGPLVGLLGTLIPLGPGITALGQGDTATLSQSLLIAFDTTIAGVVCGGICFVLSSIRKRWYQIYLSRYEAILNEMLDRMKGGKKEGRIA